MLQLHEGEMSVQAPALQLEPLSGRLKAQVFSASF
jgi:hypothetical protein